MTGSRRERFKLGPLLGVAILLTVAKPAESGTAVPAWKTRFTTSIGLPAQGPVLATRELVDGTVLAVVQDFAAVTAARFDRDGNLLSSASFYPPFIPSRAAIDQFGSVTVAALSDPLPTHPSTQTGDVWTMKYLGVTVTSASGCSANGSLSIPVVACATGFYTVTPCRLLGTRNTAGPLGGPAISSAGERTFAFVGHCGIAETATAVSLNLVVVQPTAGPGHLTAYSADAPRPLVSTINYRAGQIRANNTIVTLGPAGDVRIYCAQGGGTANVVVDVNGGTCQWK